jgi:hypothetical protein
MGAFREAWLKPVVYGLGAVLLLLFGGLGIGRLGTARFRIQARSAGMAAIAFTGVGLLALAGLARSTDWLSYVTIRRFTLDANHAWVSLVAFALAAGAALLAPTDSRRWIRLQRILMVIAGSGLALAAVSGAIMSLKLGALPSLTRLGYTGFEIGLALALFAGAVRLFLRIAIAMSTPAPSSD